MPTADDVARAIVAASRETLEDPVACAKGELRGRGGLILKCRHYAMHALVHCFPDLGGATYARLVGAPGRPAAFFTTSLTNVIRFLPGTKRRRAIWWSEAAYERVIRAVEDWRGKRAGGVNGFS